MERGDENDLVTTRGLVMVTDVVAVTLTRIDGDVDALMERRDDTVCDAVDDIEAFCVGDDEGSCDTVGDEVHDGAFDADNVSASE